MRQTEQNKTALYFCKPVTDKIQVVVNTYYKSLKMLQCDQVINHRGNWLGKFEITWGLKQFTRKGLKPETCTLSWWCCIPIGLSSPNARGVIILSISLFGVAVRRHSTCNCRITKDQTQAYDSTLEVAAEESPNGMQLFISKYQVTKCLSTF